MRRCAEGGSRWLLITGICAERVPILNGVPRVITEVVSSSNTEITLIYQEGNVKIIYSMKINFVNAERIYKWDGIIARIAGQRQARLSYRVKHPIALTIIAAQEIAKP